MYSEKFQVLPKSYLMFRRRLFSFHGSILQACHYRTRVCKVLYFSRPVQKETLDFCIWPPKILFQPLVLDSSPPPNPCHIPCSALRPPLRNVN